MIHKVSDYLKFPVFDKKIVARVFGLNMAGLAAVLSFVVYPTHAFNYDLVQTSGQTIASSPAPVEMTTQTQYQAPLAFTLGISQRFYLLHPGVDLRAPKGTAVSVIADGIVVEIGEITIGYGHFVRIAHNGTVSSLYAHLDKINVRPGQKVEKGEQIGTVGVTGWSTGPHLHFEIHEGNEAVDPLKYVSVI